MNQSNPNISTGRSAQNATRRSHWRFVLIGIVVIATIVAAATVVIFMQRNDAIAAYQTATTNLGNGMSQQTSQALNSVDRVLGEVADNLGADLGATPEKIRVVMGAQSSFDLLVSAGKGASFVTALAIADSQGVIRNSFGKWSLANNDDVVKNDFYFHFRDKDDRNAFVSAPLKVIPSGLWSVFLSRRINNAHGVFAGVAIAEISLASIEQFYRGAMPANRSVSLVRRDGVVLVRFPNEEGEIGRKIPDQNRWYAAVERGGGAYQDVDYFSATKVVAFVRPLKNISLAVQASVRESEVLADWPRQVLWILIGAAAAMTGVVLLLRYLSAQVDRLEGAKIGLAEKNLDLETAHSQLDAALANITLGVCFFSGEKKLIVSNNKYRAIYNLTADATRPGTSLSELMDHLLASGRFPRGGQEAFSSSRTAMQKTGDRQQAIIELMSGQTIVVTHQPMPHNGWISTHEDITERREADRHVRFLAHHDVLTGLANRAFFNESLDGAVARLRRQGEPFNLFMMDLDKFKNVNDTLGHPAGDQLLKEVAHRLKTSLRETDVLARLGGDEFAIIQSGEENPREGAANLAKRILRIVTEPYDLEGNIVSIGASIGIVLAPDHANNCTELLKMADVALYAVKTAGRNDFRFFDEGMLANVYERGALEHDLRIGILRGEFELHYQAIIDVSTNQPAAFEALVRWRSPTRGLVGPDQFIPLAEESGLIVPLGEWILQTACADAMKWPANIQVAVNMSPVQLAHQDILLTVQHALAKSSLPPERLVVEITETALFQNASDCVELIRKLKKFGIFIALDDFGTGYSSLSYLTTIPFDKIKIDRSFTANITTRHDCAAVVAAVVTLGQSLKAQTVAEGVETEEQFSALRAAGVTMVQGYLFGRPCPISEITFDNVALVGSFASAA